MIISVITIVKNGMPFIKDTISSVVAQKYPHIEYIVIDGNSSDGTVDLIHNYREGITKFISEDDCGISDAFNKGLNFASGDYILFLNADDALIDADVLNQAAEKILENQCPDILYGDCEVIERLSSTVLYRASIDVTIKQYLRGGIFPHPSTFTKKEYFQKYGFFDARFKIAMDYELYMRGIQDVRIVHNPFLVSRVRNGGVSTFDQASVANEIILALKKHGYLNNFFTEFTLRLHFCLRRWASRLLSALGLYQQFQVLRNKIHKS